MTAQQLSAMLGKSISITCPRMGLSVPCEVCDVKNVYGNLRIRVRGTQGPLMWSRVEGSSWFEPTKEELESVK